MGSGIGFKKIDIVNNWIDNLSNPKYTQNIGAFKSKKKKDCFCIQGLFLNTIHSDFKRGSWIDHLEFKVEDGWSIFSMIGYMDLLKISDEFTYNDYDLICGLAGKNDMSKITFKEAVIEIKKHFNIV